LCPLSGFATRKGTPPSHFSTPFEGTSDVGAGSNNGSEAVAGLTNDGGAAPRHTEDSGAEQLQRGGGMERKGCGKPGMRKTKD